MRKGSRRILLAVVLVGGLLAGLAWWKGVAAPGAPANAAPPPAQTAAAPKAEAAAFTPGRAQPYHGAAIPAPSAREQRCEAARRARLRAELATIRSEASASAALDHALLADAIGFPEPGAGPQAWKIGRVASARRWQAARKRWPDDLDIAWFAAMHCDPEDDCDRTASARHLLALDGHNVVAWLVALQDAQLRHDPDAYWRLLHQAAREARFSDSRSGTVYLHMKPLLVGTSTPECVGSANMQSLEGELGRTATAEDLAAIEAFGMELAAGMPSYSVLSECKPERAALSSERWADCTAVLGRLADGETMIEHGIGLTLLIPLLGDGPGGAAARERYREFRWLYEANTRLPPTHDVMDAIWAQGEVALLRQRAQAAGLWPPPRGWLPPDARGRALILHGRPPPDPR
ncbi:MAG TPA: hypothetical protein VM576_01835 [Xanthomonadaceae bacterium]|nr:hypothetical protein [Xanthomonadaceae bacterium]